MCLDALAAHAPSTGHCQASLETCKLPLTCKTPWPHHYGWQEHWVPGTTWAVSQNASSPAWVLLYISFRVFMCHEPLDFYKARSWQMWPSPCCWSWRWGSHHVFPCPFTEEHLPWAHTVLRNYFSFVFSTTSQKMNIFNCFPPCTISFLLCTYRDKVKQWFRVKLKNLKRWWWENSD